jgi:hypothetical protein
LDPLLCEAFYIYKQIRTMKSKIKKNQRKTAGDNEGDLVVVETNLTVTEQQAFSFLSILFVILVFFLAIAFLVVCVTLFL